MHLLIYYSTCAVLEAAASRGVFRHQKCVQYTPLYVCRCMYEFREEYSSNICISHTIIIQTNCISMQKLINILLYVTGPYSVRMCFSCRFTARVDELIRVLKDLQVGKYQRTMVSSKPAEGQGKCGLFKVVLCGVTKLLLGYLAVIFPCSNWTVFIHDTMAAACVAYAL